MSARPSVSCPADAGEAAGEARQRIGGVGVDGLSERCRRRVEFAGEQLCESEQRTRTLSVGVEAERVTRGRFSGLDLRQAQFEFGATRPSERAVG